MRWGWPAANIMWATHKGDPVEWMMNAVEGEDTLEVDYATAAGVVLQLEHKEDADELLDIPVTVETPARKFVHPQSVKMAKLPAMKGEEVTEKKIWATCGDYVAVVTGTGKTIRQACERAYKAVEQVHVPDLGWRDDIGEKLEKEVPELQKHGFALEFNYG